MTDVALLMQKRMALVEKIAAMNAKQLLYTQRRSGLEVELLACVNEIEANGESAEALARRAELEACHKAAEEACANCEREVDELAEQLNTLDQGGPGT